MGDGAAKSGMKVVAGGASHSTLIVDNHWQLPRILPSAYPPLTYAEGTAIVLRAGLELLCQLGQWEGQKLSGHSPRQLQAASQGARKNIRARIIWG